MSSSNPADIFIFRESISRATEWTRLFGGEGSDRANSLTIDDLFSIIDIQLKDLHANLSNRKNKLRITKTAKNLLIKDGSHREWGARPLRRIIQNEIENTISSKFLSGEFVDNGIITIKGKSGKLLFTQKQLEQKVKDKMA